MKFTMIIADDERLARQSEELFVKREFPDIEIVGTAQDGIMLKQMLEELKPDLAIVDIRMPGLTGLEAIELAKSKGIQTHFLINSAYSDFEYVRSALNLKTDGYLLKPCKREEHVRAIASMCEIVENEKKERQELTQVRSALDVVRPSLENELILSIISGEPDQRAFKAYCSMRGIDFSKGCMLSLLAEKRNTVLDMKEYSAAIEKILGDLCVYFSSITGNSVILALILPVELGQDRIKTWVQEIALTLAEELENFCGQKFMYGLGTIQDCFENMSLSYQESRRVLTEEEKEGSDASVHTAEQEEFSKNRDYSERAQQYIAEHYREDIALEDCAQFVGISSYYLSHLLKDTTGRSFMEHLSTLRLEEAKRLSRDTSLTSAQIAVQSGYSNASYFYRVFKKATGMTITEYRNRNI